MVVGKVYKGGVEVLIFFSFFSLRCCLKLFTHTKMLRPARRIEIEKLRREGYQAAESGKSINNNPYSVRKDGMNVIHWVDGFNSYEPPRPEIEIPIYVPLCNINHDWYCGCGHWNGCNLSVCARCGRTPSETPQ